MGKIDDNGTMRDPSSEESTQIGQKIKGGISPEYELIKTIDVSQLSEPVSMITITEDEDGNSFAYDDIVIDLDDIVGSAQGKLQVTTFCNSSQFGNHTQSNVLTTSSRNFVYTLVREGANFVNVMRGGYSTNTQVNKNNSLVYTDKVDEVRIITDTTFTSGIIKIYGKVKY